MKANFRSPILLTIFGILICFCTAGFGISKDARGIVFHDLNGNGRHDTVEPGVAGVKVSNQVDVVTTDSQGRYRISVDDETIIFITKPAGYQVPLNELKLPQFYYIHQPNGSPEGLKYEGIAPTGPLPESVDFPLIKNESNTKFTAIISGDPQPRNETEVNYFRDDIATKMVGTDAAFYMALGDIAYDNLEIYDQYNRAVAQAGIPAYNVHGNHDMNFRVPDDRHAAETFKKIYGPPYYSFEYGKVHFIVLDDIDYYGWDSLNDRKGRYRGHLDENQLKWLENDLARVPPENLVVLAMHIPIHTAFGNDDAIHITNRNELFEILEKREHVLAVAAHMHFIEHVTFTREIGWQGKSLFRSINTGAACGAWWSGRKDGRGIPDAFCGDGSPNGYFVFTFDDVNYSFRFVPANEPADYQMRISSPFGMLPADSLKGRQIIANIFAAEPGSDVQVSVDGGTPRKMVFAPQHDPFMTAYLEQYRETFASWIKEPAVAFHIWTAALPEALAPGTHRIVVTARDSWGQIYRGVRLFEVTE